MTKIVEKPWGHENRWAVTDKYIGKLLHIECGHKLSRQYHEKKDESIYVLEGRLLLELGSEPDVAFIVLEKGASWRIEPGTVHRFSAPSQNCTLIEVSTPEIEDVVRLQDDYNRK
tara:strand:+ start:4415 stop:4759 length:345 start_codon:yes stop_codon:yes gene_type:complete